MNSKTVRTFSIAVLFLTISCAHTKSSVTSLSETQMFGVRFRWVGEGQQTTDWLSRQIKNNQDKLPKVYDPDCYYRSEVEGHCELSEAIGEVQELRRFADLMKAETNGVFDAVTLKKGRRRLDLGGLAQGYFLEQLKQGAPGLWLGDFAGDIFYSGGFHIPHPFIIPDPIFEGLVYATVEMPGGGWILSSSARSMGADIRPANSREEIKKVVLFASPDFHGGRLDAWSTAIIAGGLKTLKRLTQLHQFNSKWAYLYFDPAGELYCSKNIQCPKSNSQSKIIVIKWGS